MTEMTFDVPSFNNGSDGLNQKSSGASADLTSGVTSNLAPPAASSPVGGTIAMLTAQLQGGLATVGPSLTQAAASNNSNTHSALSAIQAQDASNSAKFTAGNGIAQAVGDAAGQAGGAGSDTAGAAQDASAAAQDATSAAEDAAGAAGDLDPASIDQEARDKAAQMLGGDQMTQQMGQMLGQAAQVGAQAGQQLSQQFNQVGQQVGQAVQQAGQQLGQLVGKATQSLSSPSLGVPDLGTAGLGGLGTDMGGGGGAGDIGGAPDFGGAGDFGGGGGLGDMSGGIGDGPGTDAAGPGMTTSPALLPSPLTPPGTGPGQQTAATARVPAMMPPMMPMVGAGQQGEGKTTKRDPVIFAERPLYESPEGVAQTIGARPEIESEEPPFGDSAAEASGR